MALGNFSATVDLNMVLEGSKPVLCAGIRKVGLEVSILLNCPALCPPKRFWFCFGFLPRGLSEAHFIHLNLSSHNGNHLCLGRALVALDSDTLLVVTSLPGASHNNLLPLWDRDIAVCYFLKSETKRISLSAESLTQNQGRRQGWN